MAESSGRLARIFRTAPTPLATLVTALAVGFVDMTIQARANDAPLAAPRVVLVLAGFGFSTAALVIACSGTLWRSPSAVATHLRVGIASSALIAWQIADVLYFGSFRRHLDAAAVELGVEAFRTKTAHLAGSDLVAFVFAGIVVAALVAFVHAMLSGVSCEGARERRLRVTTGIVVVLGLGAALFRARLSDERHEAATRLAAALPCAENPQAPLSSGLHGFGSTVDDQLFAALTELRPKIEAAQFTARERPDLLIVHVESLRSDVATAALMPRLTALSSECWRARRHYTTGNNTGMSVFGLVTGLGGVFYSDARRARLPALPLVVLRRLGYRTHVLFSNDLAEYDGIFDVVFQGAVDEAFTAPKGPSNETDLVAIDHYLASLDGPKDGPRFDYLVLDSTHYDYVYPPEFERHTPVARAALGLKQFPVIKNGINEESLRLAPLYKNRYLNSVEWMDTVIARLVDGLRARGRWGKTWVVITGDHGEAFWEHGTMGHGGALEEQEIRVPMLSCGSPHASGSWEYSSHADVMPTWFEQMGIVGSPGPFMSGRSLVVYRPETDVAVAGMGVTGVHFTRRLAAMGYGLKVEFENSRDLPIFSVTDAEDRPLGTTPEAVYSVLTAALGAKLLRSPALE